MALFTGAVHGDFSGGFRGVRRYLFETLPNIFPWGRLTKVESALWARYAEERQAKMADIQKTIEILFAGTDKVSGTIDTIGGKLDSFGGGLSDIASPFEAATSSVLKLEAAMCALAVGGLAVAYAKSVEFDSAMVGLQKVLGDVSQGEIDNLRAQILKLSDDYGVASTAVTESITGWKQAGFEMENN